MDLGSGMAAPADGDASPLAEFRMIVESMGLPVSEDQITATWDQAGGDSEMALEQLLDSL